MIAKKEWFFLVSRLKPVAWQAYAYIFTGLAVGFSVLIFLHTQNIWPWEAGTKLLITLGLVCLLAAEPFYLWYLMSREQQDEAETRKAAGKKKILILKKEWFQIFTDRSKMMPCSWQGWLYCLVFVAGLVFIYKQDLWNWPSPLRRNLTLGLSLVFVADMIHIWASLRRDSRE